MYRSLAMILVCSFFFFQAEDGIRDLVRSRGLGDVYKRQAVLSAYQNYEKDADRIKKLQNHIYENYSWDLIARKHLEVYNIVCTKYINIEENSLNQRKSSLQIAQAYNYLLKGDISAAVKSLPSLFNSSTDNPLSYYPVSYTHLTLPTSDLV